MPAAEPDQFSQKMIGIGFHFLIPEISPQIGGKLAHGGIPVGKTSRRGLLDNGPQIVVDPDPVLVADGGKLSVADVKDQFVAVFPGDGICKCNCFM